MYGYWIRQQRAIAIRVFAYYHVNHIILRLKRPMISARAVEDLRIKRLPRSKN